jgi:hypothetical protein
MVRKILAAAVCTILLTSCGPVPPKQQNDVMPRETCRGRNGVLMLCGEGA